MACWIALGLAFAISNTWQPLFALLLAAAVVCDALALQRVAPANRAGERPEDGNTSSSRRVAALGAHKVLVIERLILSVAFAATVMSPVKALVLLAALASATWWAQLRLRNRYEFAPTQVEAPVGGPGIPPEEKGESRGHAGASARPA
jgi:hypothetical protein